MTAQIIDLAVYRAAHSRPVARVRLVFDPLLVWRFWLACWVVR